MPAISYNLARASCISGYLSDLASAERSAHGWSVSDRRACDPYCGPRASHECVRVGCCGNHRNSGVHERRDCRSRNFKTGVLKEVSRTRTGGPRAVGTICCAALRASHLPFFCFLAGNAKTKSLPHRLVSPHFSIPPTGLVLPRTSGGLQDRINAPTKACRVFLAHSPKRGLGAVTVVKEGTAVRFEPLLQGRTRTVY
jgi:hypothetical protein